MEPRIAARVKERLGSHQLSSPLLRPRIDELIS
jgi:hypothetical protein